MDKVASYVLSDIKKYVDYVKDQIPVERIILFGSHTTGSASSGSDIDLAIVSQSFGISPLVEQMKLFGWRFHAHVESELQPFPFGIEEFEAAEHFFIEEIRKTGIDITREVLST